MKEKLERLYSLCSEDSLLSGLLNLLTDLVWNFSPNFAQVIWYLLASVSPLLHDTRSLYLFLCFMCLGDQFGGQIVC